MSKRKQKRKVNHLFAKLIVCYCVVCGTAAVAYCIRAQANGLRRMMNESTAFDMDSPAIRVCRVCALRRNERQ